MSATARLRPVQWIALGAVLALAATLLVTQTWRADAAPGDSDATFVPTAGCRLTDTRPAPNNVGPRSTPLGADDILEVAVHGANGNCTGALAIPSDAVGVALNVTAVNATTSSNIRLYPANLTEVPLLSNLNVSAGAPPTPNKVDVQLSPTGAIKVYNFKGSVDIILDVVGYYTKASLQELAQRVAALETANAALQGDIADLGNQNDSQQAAIEDLGNQNDSQQAAIEDLGNQNDSQQADIEALQDAQPFAVSAHVGSSTSLTTTPASVVGVPVTAPVAGQVTVNYSAFTTNDTLGQANYCAPYRSTEIPGGDIVSGAEGVSYFETADATNGDDGSLSGTRTFSIGAGQTVTFAMACEERGGNGAVDGATITAIFTPAP